MEPEVAKIDQDVRAGFAALAAKAEGAAPAPGTPTPTSPTADEWRMPVMAGIELFAAQAPNWTIEGEHKQMVADALTQILNDLWPGGLGNIDQWGPYAKLAFAAGAIALANFDWSTRKLKPLQRPQPEKEKEGGNNASA